MRWLVAKGSLRALWLVYPLTFLFPRKKGIWLFGTEGERFAENPKYLFLFIVRNHPEISAYWITGSSQTYEALRNLHLPVLRRWSLRGVYFALRAEVYFFSCYASDINFWLSGGAVHVNLWHGVGIKQIEFGITSGPLKKKMIPSLLNRLVEPYRFRRPEYFLSTTRLMSEHFAHCFRIPITSCMEYGYPRTDIFFNEEFRSYCLRLADYSYMLQSLKQHRKTFLLAPTLRDSGESYLEAANLNLGALDRVLATHDSLLIVKLHPSEPNHEIREKFVGLKNVLLWPSDLDIHPLLPEFDVLITDYSSLYYDFILLERPVIIYTYDRRAYNRESRLFALNFDENVVGETATNEEQLRNLLESQLRVNPNTQEVMRKFWGNYSGNSCEMIFDRIAQVTVHR